MAGEKYNLNLSPKGYNTNIAADLLDSIKTGQWLTKGTQNVLIDEDGSISTRKGLSLLGSTGGSGGVAWADTWTTSTNSDRPMRTIFDRLQVFYEGAWEDVKTGFGNNIEFCGGSWWDRDQSMDRYVWVNKTTNMFSWQGGITRVESRVSGTSLKKVNGGTPTSKTISIASGNTVSWGFPLGVSNPTVRNSLVGSNGFGNFWDAGFRAGDTIALTFTGISGSYTIASVDIANNQILITGDFGTTGSSTTTGQSITCTANAYGPLAKTWAQERFPSSGTMSFVLMGVTYTYTGGFNTDTLTGISPALPAVIPSGTIIMSGVLTHTPSGGDYSVGATPSILTVSNNQVWLGDTDRNWVWFSHQGNFSDFTYSVPVRANGQGGSARLDKNIRAIITNDQDNSIRVSAGRDTWYPISLVSVTSNGIAGEEVRVGTPKRGSGVGANNQFSVCNTKQGVMYLSQEPMFDYLQNVEQLNQVVTPVGDNIADDLYALDTTNAKTLYWQKHVWLLLPNAGLLYGYDMLRQLWQPPQTVAGSCMSIIDEQLVIHSIVRQESYIMFSGTNDNGYPISFVVRPNYVNGGTRERYKTLDGYFVEAKVTDNTDSINFKAMLGYRGSKGTVEGTFGSTDGNPFVETPTIDGGFGQGSIGQDPFGSLYTNDEIVQYKKVRRIFPFTKNNNEFFEMQVQFSCDKLDSQFKILAHGDNMQLTSSQNSNLIKI